MRWFLEGRSSIPVPLERSDAMIAALRLGLLVALAVVALLKTLYPLVGVSGLAPWVYWSVGVIEIVLAIMFATKWYRLAAMVTILVVAGAPCGCFGHLFDANRRDRIWIAGAIGLASSVTLHLSWVHER